MEASSGPVGGRAALRAAAKVKGDGRRPRPWNPRLTVSKSVPIFVAVGVLFAAVGSVILVVFRNAEEVTIDYTWCASADNATQLCAALVGKSTRTHAPNRCRCEVPFAIERDIVAPVFLYYGPTDLGRNRRECAKWRDDRPSADHPSPPSPTARCAAAAAAAAAPSADTLTVYAVHAAAYVPLVRTGVAWPDVKCCQRRNAPGDRRNAFDHLQNEDFVVWMQPASPSTFAKLYGSRSRSRSRSPNRTTAYFNGSLPAGEYRLLVSYTYPVTAYGGTKSLIIANTTVLGGKNTFLGVAYVVTGAVCIGIAVVLFAMRLRDTKSA